MYIIYMDDAFGAPGDPMRVMVRFRFRFRFRFRVRARVSLVPLASRF